MSTEVITCDLDDELSAIEQRMSHHQLHRLPVVDDRGLPVGIISLNDLARATGLISAPDIVSTFAAVCAPRPPMATRG